MNDTRTPLPPPSAWPPPTVPPVVSPGGEQPALPPREPGLDRSDLRPPPLPSRPLWMIAGSVLLLGAVFWGCFQIVSLLAREEWTSTYTQPAAGITTLHVRNDGGRVTVRGADTDDITVRADVSRGLFGIDESAEVVDDRYELSADCPPLGNEWCSVDYEIVVPRDLHVDVVAQNGTVAVSGIEAPVEARADNGRIELDDVTGSVVASSDNGRVIGTGLTSADVDARSDNGRVELTFVAAPETVFASSQNGSVEVAVPDVDGDYAVDAQTDNGSRNIEITSDPTSSRTISMRSDNGSVTVRYVG